MEKPTLKTIFLGLQAQMRTKLASDRGILFHPTTKGDASELNWKEWLETYIPKRYQVDKAFVIDSNNRFSQQLDLVIYDRQYSPFVFNQDGAIYIPAESVYAIFEVKQEFNKENLEYAGEKIKSVRTLNRTSAPIVHAGGRIIDPKPPLKIMGGMRWFGFAGHKTLLILCNDEKENHLVRQTISSEIRRRVQKVSRTNDSWWPFCGGCGSVSGDS